MEEALQEMPAILTSGNLTITSGRNNLPVKTAIVNPNQLPPPPSLPALPPSGRAPIYYGVQGQDTLDWRQGTVEQ